MLIVSAIIFLLLAILLQKGAKPSIAFFGLALLYCFLGFINIEGLLLNFVNSALVTLILLLIISLVLEKTTFITALADKLFSKSFTKSYFKLGIVTSFLSAFLNNTAVVASMISVVQKNRYHAPSKFLPNRFLQKRQQNFFIQARVQKSSKLVGKTIEQNGLRNLEYLFLSEIVRAGRVIASVSPDEVIKQDDVLVFSGDIKEIKLLEQFHGLEFAHSNYELSKNLVEVILSHESTLVGKKIKESNFRTKFNATVVAVKRGEEKLSGKIGEIKLQTGDSLILAVGSDFYSRENLKKNFYFTNEFAINKKLDKKQSFIAVGGFFSVLALSFFEIIPLIKGLFGLLVLFVGLKYIDLSEIKRRFPYELVLVIGSALAISGVIIESGLSTLIAGYLQYFFGGFGVYGAFIAVYLLSFILTEIITNNAAAALAFPIAYSMALFYDASFMPFMLAVAYGASASFMTPYGYQTNLMVSSVGGYSFKNFIKSGSLVSLIYGIVALLLIPLFFPF